LPLLRLFFGGRAAKLPKQGKGLSQKQGSFSMLKATAKPIKSIIIPAGADLPFVPAAETKISLQETEMLLRLADVPV
jgi:hypothetical protein